MNERQAIWWEQIRSDFEVFELLGERGASPCHSLHYLQMVTEKLGKAYYWRLNVPPPKSNASFVRFLQLLDNRPEVDRARIAGLFGFGRPADFRHWIGSITPLAYELERLAPALAGDDGPNPEYPWPRETPEHAPATFDFTIWPRLISSTRGRQLLRVIEAAVRHFPHYA